MVAGIDIEKRRNELGMKQADLARKVGVSLTTVRNWKNGVTEPKDENKQRLVKVLSKKTEARMAKNSE